MKRFVRPIWIYCVATLFFSVLSNVAMAYIPFFTQTLLKQQYLLAVEGYVICIFPTLFVISFKCALIGGKVSHFLIY